MTASEKRRAKDYAEATESAEFAEKKQPRRAAGDGLAGAIEVECNRDEGAVPSRVPKRRPSDSTERLIEALYEPKGILYRVFRADERLEIVERIAEAGEPEAIPELLQLVLTGERKIAQASAGAVERLLKQLKAVDFVRFDQFVRQGNIDWSRRTASWYELKTKDVEYFAGMGPAGVSVLGIASCHGSGYVREAAIRKLGECKTGAELPFLLMRLNDWVGRVRGVARELVERRIEPGYVGYFLEWLPLVPIPGPAAGITRR